MPSSVTELEVYLSCYFAKRLHNSYHVHLHTMYTFTHVHPYGKPDAVGHCTLAHRCMFASTVVLSQYWATLIPRRRKCSMPCAAEAST